MLNLNPVVVAKHFKYRLECLFRDVLLGTGDPIGRVLYDAVRIKFQFRGPPHAHCFIWIKDCPVLTDDNIELFVKFIDKHISAILPDPVSCPVLHDLVKHTVHMHIQRHVDNTKIYHAGLILVIFSLKRQLL